MGHLFKAIQQLVAVERYVVGQHAVERLEERGILEWQVVASLAEGRLIAERPAAKPNSTVEVSEIECWSDVLCEAAVEALKLELKEPPKTAPTDAK